MNSPSPWWRLLGWWVLAAGVCLSGWLAWLQWQAAEARAHLRFERETQGFSASLEARFRELATLLRATSGYFAGSDRVAPEEFTAFARQLDLRALQPGIQGLGYTLWLPADARAQTETAMRARGLGDFRSWPVCGGASFSAIVSLEPLDPRNRRAIGYDMHCEPTRRAAMDAAAASTLPVLSGRVRLVQEGQERAQPGVLLYQALFDSRSGRPADLVGWTYMPIRLGDLFRVLLRHEPHDGDFVLEVSDTTRAPAAALIGVGGRAVAGARYRATQSVRLYGRVWRLDYASTAAYEAGISRVGAYYSLAAGLAFSLLATGAIEWLARSRRRAERLALAMTRDLRLREAELETLFQSSPDATLIVDASGRIVRHNPEARRLFGYPDGELDGLEVEALIPEAQRATHRQHRARFAGHPQSRQMGSGLSLSAQRVDGSVFLAEAMLVPLTLQRSPHVLVVIRDISERKRQEAQLATMLAEKETLLQEVHHRVKNNLQVIHSLFDLQNETVNDPVARACLADAQSRVRAMALIHQVLYQSRDFGEVNFADYLTLLLRDLSATLGRPGITVRTEVEPVRMTLERAIPCGLLMSEAVSNAFKHAFPQQRAGTIVLTLKQTGEMVEMMLSDDGIGLPPNWRERDTLGMRLIDLLAEQCGARLEIVADHGTRVRLAWDERDKPR